jgi:hypothetical protein
MRPPEWPEAESEVLERLRELFEVEARVVRSEVPEAADLAVTIDRHRFVLDYRSASGFGGLVKAIEHLQLVRGRSRAIIPILVVPYMSEPGRERCQAAGLSWLDLCGNAHIRGPGLTVKVEGRPNRFRVTGRPPTAFAPRSSRLARRLLIEPERSFTQHELAGATGLSEPLVSRVARRLEADGLVERDGRGALRAHAPALLLDAWRDSYDFAKHDVRRGHLPARDGTGLLRGLAEAFANLGIEHAVTGLGAAWLLNKFAGFNTVTFYLKAWPRRDVLDPLGFREGAPASNVWLVCPNDEGVFHGAQEVHGVRCVHPVQVYLDLKGQPERAPEAAAQLRRETLKWVTRAE